MIVGLLLRHYKNYANIRFIKLINDTDHMFSIYIGNNGVGKSAILEALDLVMNGHRAWNVTQGEKKSEAFICPLFLIPKNSIPLNKKNDFEKVSQYFWGNEPDKNSAVKTIPDLKDFIDFKNSLKKYEKTHYIILVGNSNDEQCAFFSSSFDTSIKELLGDDKEVQNKKANNLRDYILDLYSYIYIPVEESPKDLLQLQNNTMQKLLNKDIQKEIERIVNTKQDGQSIVTRINKNLDAFINDINKNIMLLDPDYSYAPEGGGKKKLTAKDIRAKIIEAFFPLRSLKKRQRRVELLSSGEQRKAIIDIAYSTLIANKDRKTAKQVILALDEPEMSMHISNCYDQFARLEELSEKAIQIVITTHWYGYLPIARNGLMHYLEVTDKQTAIRTFDLYNLIEKRRYFPNDVELKSMFDLASSLITYMRKENNYKWIFCEGSDDKIYIQTMLKQYDNIHIIPLGGCGNVTKLYQIMVGFMTEKSEGVNSDALFIIDTDKKRNPYREPFTYSTTHCPISLYRLQVEEQSIKLLDPSSGGTYEQTEIEDCLNPEIYYNAVKQIIESTKDRSLKATFKKYEFVQGSKISKFRGDDSCIVATDPKVIPKKKMILDFIENDEYKKVIAEKYSELCKNTKVKHQLAEIIINQLGL